jgi:DNA-3-methyladenine glycosylase
VYARSSVALARALLGTLLVRDAREGRTSGIIVETEAYGGPEDAASHARAGRTARTAPMFGPAGHAYVYLVYGLHHCLNAVAERDGIAGAVLIRGAAPVEGLDLMRHRRGRPHDADARLAAGPARLCQAFGIDRDLDGADLTAGRALWLEAGDAGALDPGRVVTGPRVGVGYAGGDWAGRPWRFGLRDHPSLSRPFPDLLPHTPPGT